MPRKRPDINRFVWVRIGLQEGGRSTTIPRMERQLPELFAGILWGLLAAVVLYGTVRGREKTPRLTRFLILVICALTGCLVAAYFTSYVTASIRGG